MTLIATPLHKNPCPRGHKICNFCRSFLDHHFYTLSLYEPCPKDLLRNTSYYTFTPKLHPLGVGGHEICLLTLPMLHTKFGQDRPSIS